MKNPGKEASQSTPTSRAAAESNPTKDDLPVAPPEAPQSSESVSQDPKAISESLRRIRTSGPLIIEAIKQNNERAREIIAQSIQGLSENKTDAARETRPTPPPPPPPPPIQKVKKRDKTAGARANRPVNQPLNTRPNLESGSRPALPTSAGLASAKAPTAKADRQPGAETPAQSQSQSLAPPSAVTRTTSQAVAKKVSAAVAATETATRKTTSFLSRSIGRSTHAGANGAHNGPSIVLVQASGFKPQSGFGPKVVIVVIALLVLVAAGIYFPFRDKLLPPPSAESGRNLMSPDEQSALLVKEGSTERDQGKYSSAVERFHSALELAPNNPDIRFLLAQTYLLDGKIDEAQKGYREILRFAPEHLEARLQLAEIYRLRGMWPAAYKEYQNIIELNQNSPQAEAALIAIEKYEGATQPIEKTAKTSQLRRIARPGPTVPQLPGALIRPEIPLVAPGFSAPGIAPPTTLNSIRPEEKPDPRVVAGTHRRLGERYYNIREFRAAINEFLRALSLTPEDKDLYYLIGSSYHGLGLYSEAHDYYRRVDAGPYLGPAQSGAKQTEKAAREASKRRGTLKFQSMNNELRSEPEIGRPGKSFMNKILDGLR